MQLQRCGEALNDTTYAAGETLRMVLIGGTGTQKLEVTGGGMVLDNPECGNTRTNSISTAVVMPGTAGPVTFKGAYAGPTYGPVSITPSVVLTMDPALTATPCSDGSNPGEPNSADADAADEATRILVAYHADLNRRNALIVAHALSMLAAWGLLLPAGAAMAHFGKARLPAKWFGHHRNLQCGGLGLFFCAFIFAVAGADVFGAHFKSTHAVLGLLVLLGALAQGAAGYFRPHKAAEGEPQSRARKLFETGHKLGGYGLLALGLLNIFLGMALLNNADAHADLVALYASMLLLSWVGAFLALTKVLGPRWWAPADGGKALAVRLDLDEPVAAVAPNQA